MSKANIVSLETDGAPSMMIKYRVIQRTTRWKMYEFIISVFHYFQWTQVDWIAEVKHLVIARMAASRSQTVFSGVIWKYCCLELISTSQTILAGRKISHPSRVTGSVFAAGLMYVLWSQPLSIPRPVIHIISHYRLCPKTFNDHSLCNASWWYRIKMVIPYVEVTERSWQIRKWQGARERVILQVKTKETRWEFIQAHTPLKLVLGHVQSFKIRWEELYVEISLKPVFFKW